MSDYFKNLEKCFGIDEVDANQHLNELVRIRLDKNKKELDELFWYKLEITKTPTRTNYHQFSFEKLQEISRKFTNGLQTFGFIPNRIFFKKYFLGGIRTIQIEQLDVNSFPSFTLNYLLYSNLDNVDIKYKTNLTSRVKFIDPTLEISFQFLDRGKRLNLEEHIRTSTNVDLTSEFIQKLGKNNIKDIIHNQFQRPRFLGNLYKNK